MLRQSIIDQIKLAMRSKDANTLSVLRFILSEIKNVEIDAKQELNDNQIISLLRKEVKRRKEAIEQYKVGNRQDIVTKEIAELAIIDTFLPAQMDPQEIETIITQVIVQNPGADFGQIMRLCIAATQGQADGKLVSQIVRSKLS